MKASLSSVEKSNENDLEGRSKEHSREVSRRMFLHARIVFITNDLDMTLLKEATLMRRLFLEEQKMKELKEKKTNDK